MDGGRDKFPLDMPTPPSPRPFLKWAGGKRQLLDELLTRIPASHGAYHEPFLGGGALFYRLSPDRAVLSDLNHRLVRTYGAVRDQVESVIGHLSHHPNDKDFFLEMRARDIDAEPNEDEPASERHQEEQATNDGSKDLG